jgi:hypothetical protein
MTLIYDDLVPKVLRLLDDPDGAIFSEELVWDGICGAHDALMPYLPKFAVETLTAGSAGDSFLLPADLYTIQAVQDVDSGLVIPRATLAPRTAKSIAEEDNDWTEYPHGYLSLSVAKDEGDQLKLFYFAYWSKPASESDADFVIEVPQAAWVGLQLYAASQSILAKSSNTANIRQFNIQVDSGNPEHNPLKAQAELYRHLFYQEMKMMPPYVKVGQ